MKRTLPLILISTGLLLSLLAFLSLVGLGILRQSPSWAVAVGASALVVLPAAGIGAMFRWKPAGVGLGMVVWPVAVLAGLPVWFPGERVAAISTGMGFLAAPLGEESSRQFADLGERMALLAGEEKLAGEPPPPEAEPVITRLSEPPPPPERVEPLEGDQIALPYEGAGRSLRIPVVFEDDGEESERWMLYDTGATYTTLTPEALRELGVEVPPDAPIVTLQTANGERQSKLVLLDRVWIGGFPVEGVTVAVCEECGGGEDAGLLGLNVSGQFTVTTDPSRREMVLEPLGQDADRHLDVGHWVEIAATATVWSDGRVVVDVSADNMVDLPMQDLVVDIECSGQTWQATFEELAPLAEADTRVSLPRGTTCTEYRIALSSGSW